ncbi:peroxisomal membrane protein pex14 [Malassezia nana]|uniref:Peroxisomal membrane protein PEX14 n=1 Tax=Malassezia nana TaxID=180528 RepID=A0AAF0EFC8_9BASI|nr:peroxisomal membrane protein pex14 [Malassezia nana]
MSDAGATAAPSGGLRADMIQSAIQFLEDPKVQSSPVSQRISFLESKGLTPQEIDAALSQAGRAGGAAVAPRAPYPMMPAYPPVRPQRDWRDWFIMTVVAGTVGYGVVALARRYLYPHLQPPNQTALEEERDALAAKYDEVALHLEELDQTTEAMSQGLAAQQAAIAESVQGVNEMVADAREREERRDKDMEKMRDDVEELRTDVQGMFDRARQAQVSALSDLQSELKSLRSLLLSRGGLSAPAPAPTTESGASDDAPPARAAPTIPAWQLAEQE